jgi:hypothetical protein
MEEGLPKVPKLELTQLKFMLQKNPKNANDIKQKLMNGIIADSMDWQRLKSLVQIFQFYLLVFFERYDAILS